MLSNDCLQAQHNTRMLQTYADIDERVRTLGYIMKVFAKVAASLYLYFAAEFVILFSHSYLYSIMSCMNRRSLFIDLLLM